MKGYEYIIDYLRREIRVYYNRIRDINNVLSDTSNFFKALVNHDSNYTYDENIFKLFDDSKEDYDKLVKGIYILDHVDYEKLNGEKRIQDILKLINRIKAFIYLFTSKKEKEYGKLKNEYLLKRNAYSCYIELLMGNPIYQDDEVIKNDFLKFLESLKINDSIKEEVREQLLNPKKYVIQKENIIEEQEKEEREKKAKRDNLSTLSLEEIDEINELIKQYNELDEKEKNSIISAYGMILSHEPVYENVVYGFTKHEIEYLCQIYCLSNLYKSYNDLYKEENLRNSLDDEDLYEVLKTSLDETILSIQKKVQEIKDISQEMNNEEVSEVENDNHNMVIFLNTNERNNQGVMERVSILDVDESTIEKNFGGEKEGLIRQIVKMLQNRFISMPNASLKKMGHLANKPLVDYGSDLFTEFNVYSSRGRGHNPTRIAYTTLSVSEKNKKEIVARYNLPPDTNIYLILGVFIKKSNDTEYVKTVHSRLVKEYDNIKIINMLFEKDFDDITRQRAFQLLDNSNMKLDELNQSYMSMESRK